jgi:hypothetical protein
MKSEMKKKTPNIASETSRATTFAPAKVGLRNSVTSNIGRRWWSSSSTNETPATAATAKRPRISGDVQPLLFASISA